MENILVFGYFGYVSGQLDGQTIKTRAVYRLLEKYRVGNRGREGTGESVRLFFFDTERLKHGKHALLKPLLLLPKCSKVVYLPGQNNLAGFFPLLYRLSKLFGFDILYVMIGGWLPSFLEKKRALIEPLRRIKAVFPENREVENSLKQSFGFKNVHLMPNFREVSFRPVLRCPDFSQRPFRLVFMSRIVKEKGIETVFAVQAALAAKGLSSTMDFYGQIDAGSAELFECRLSEAQGVEYKGVLVPQEIIERLSSYDALILPTFYPGEGFPGAVIEANCAGIPALVSDWKYNAEYVKNGLTGFVLPLGKGQEQAYVDRIVWMREHPQELFLMKQAALQEGEKYTDEAAWKILGPFLE